MSLRKNLKGFPVSVCGLALFMAASLFVTACDGGLNPSDPNDPNNPSTDNPGAPTDGSTGPLTADINIYGTESDAGTNFGATGNFRNGAVAQSLGLTATETAAGKAYFVARKTADQTITVGGTGAALVTQHNTGAVDGATADDTHAVFAVNTNGAWLQSDGNLSFTLRVQEPEHSSKLVTVNLNVSLIENAGVIVYKVNSDGTLTDLNPTLGADRYRALDKAFRWIDANAVSNTEYLVRLNASQQILKTAISCNAIGNGNVTIRLRGAGAERTISRDTSVSVSDGQQTTLLLNYDAAKYGLIHVGASTVTINPGAAPNTAHITLRLERNITMDGLDEVTYTSQAAPAVYTIKLQALLSVAANCTLILDSGSKVTRYKDGTEPASNYYAIGVGKFASLKVMKGAQITGNNTQNVLIYQRQGTPEVPPVQLQNGFVFGTNANNNLSTGGIKREYPEGYGWFD